MSRDHGPGNGEIAARMKLLGQSMRRRSLLGGALGLAGCASSDVMSLAEAEKVYGPAHDAKFPIAAVDVTKLVMPGPFCAMHTPWRPVTRA